MVCPLYCGIISHKRMQLLLLLRIQLSICWTALTIWKCCGTAQVWRRLSMRLEAKKNLCSMSFSFDGTGIVVSCRVKSLLLNTFCLIQAVQICKPVKCHVVLGQLLAVPAQIRVAYCAFQDACAAACAVIPCHQFHLFFLACAVIAFHEALLKRAYLVIFKHQLPDVFHV